MKCEHCGKNEATFYMKSNINGVITQTHLCQDCAAALGYTQKLSRSLRRPALFSDSFFADDFFTRPFALFEPFFGELGTQLLSEFPAPTEQKAQTQAQEPSLVTGEEREKLRAQRRRNALEAQLRDAVEHEDFEHAIKLRDELRRMAS